MDGWFIHYNSNDLILIIIIIIIKVGFLAP
jgi:hypothetical protein